MRELNGGSFKSRVSTVLHRVLIGLPHGTVVLRTGLGSLVY